MLREAREKDFAAVFPLIQALWSYRRYEADETRAVYRQLLSDAGCFAFVALDGCQVTGFCHGNFFSSLWMCGLTCYLSGIITAEGFRSQGVGSAMLCRVKELAKARGCKGIFLESGLQRKDAHRFYQKRGFTRSCFGFDLLL